MFKKEKIKIGESDYTRDQLEQGRNGINLYQIIGSSKYLLPIIEAYEEEGYTVKFEISLIKRFFGVERYKIVAYRQILIID